MAGELQVNTLSRPGGHYSHVVVANGFVFVSGQLPITATGEKLVDADFDTQVTQVLTNVQHALAAAGVGIAQLVQVRVYLDDIANWPRFNTLYAAWAGETRPARAIIPTGALHFGFKIEIEATAVCHGSAAGE